ncbi:MAG TPA: 3-hydroxyacyl-[acyl-carrier-protein] dehydratase FabZ [Candidatus Nanoarchaeia archaeon]|nr:3-hydroxyacyl-[acyl-carrier-protein] dehydratase FabZ [Candidatus Nanoarchaeia archaeon]
MANFSELKNEKGEINTENIKKIIPYNEHFLFIDRVLELSSSRIVAVKKVNNNEDFLKGHFVGFPIMPGALTVEGMGQAATLLARSNIPNHHEKDVLAYRLKEVKFNSPILPGDEARFELDLIAQDERGAILKGKAFVKDVCAAEALIMLAIVNRTEFRGKYSG